MAAVKGARTCDLKGISEFQENVWLDTIVWLRVPFKRDPIQDIKQHVGYNYTVGRYAQAFEVTVVRLRNIKGLFAELDHEDAHVFGSFCDQAERNLCRIENWAEQPIEDSAFAARNVFELVLWLEWLNLNPQEHMKIFQGLLVQDLKDIENALRINVQAWASVIGSGYPLEGHPVFTSTYEDVVEHYKEQAREKQVPWVKWSDYGAGVFAAQLNRQDAHKDLYKLACKFAHPSPYSLVFPNYIEDHAYYVLAFASSALSGIEAALDQLHVVLGRLRLEDNRLA